MKRWTVPAVMVMVLLGCGREQRDAAGPAEPQAEAPPPAPIDEAEIAATDARFSQLYNTGLLFFHVNEYDQAQEAFQQALEVRETDAKPYFYLGKIYLEQKRFTPAEESAREAMRRDPNFLSGSLLLAEVLFKSNQLEEGRKHIEVLLAEHPGNAEVYYWLGFMQERLNDYPAAIAAFEKLLARDPSHIEGWFHRGLAHMKMEDWELARDAFLAALRQDPDHYGSLFNLQKVYHRLGDMENRAEIQARYQDLMTRMEEQIYKNTKIAFFSNRGITHFNAGDYEGAVKEFQTAIDMNPKMPRGYYYLGMCYLQMGKPREAVQTLEKAIEIAPDDESMMMELGRAHAMSGDLASAVEWLEKAIRRNPYLEMPHYYLAGILRTQGNMAEAQNHMAEFQRLRQLAAGGMPAGK